MFFKMSCLVIFPEAETHSDVDMEGLRGDRSDVDNRKIERRLPFVILEEPLYMCVWSVDAWIARNLFKERDGGVGIEDQEYWQNP